MGILLTDKTNDEIINPPRPVFYEELDLLGFDRYWSYPRSREPLLWAIGRRYYYSYRQMKPCISGTHLLSTSFALLLIDATKPLKERTNAVRFSQQ